MDVMINYWAVLFAAMSSMVVGTIWYGPLLGKQWMKLSGVDKVPQNKRLSMNVYFASLFVLSLVMAYVIAHVAYMAHSFFNNSFLQDSTLTALWLWLGVALTRTVAIDFSEARAREVTLINVGNQLVTMLVMGLIIGLLPA